MDRRLLISAVLLKTKGAFIATNCTPGHWFIWAKQKFKKILVVANYFGYGWGVTAIF